MTVVWGAIGVTFSSAAMGDPRDPRDPVTPGSFFDPASPGAWTLRPAVGLTVDVLPLRLVASELREIPMVTAGLRLGLPAGFSVDARVRAVVINNDVQLGVGWGHRVGRFSFGVANRASVWFGAVGVTGFDLFAYGLVDTVSAAASVFTLGSRITLGFDVILVGGQNVTLGSSTHARNLTTYAGVAFNAVVETPVFRRGMIYYGASIVVANPDYQLWLAFSEDTSRRPFPRFTVGYEF